MAIEIKEGTVRISVGYNLKVPNQVQYASEDAHVGISLEVPFDSADTVEDITDQALAIQAELHTAAKTAVFSQLNVEFDVTNGGIMVPIVKEPARNSSSSNGQRRSSGGGQRRSGGGGGGRSGGGRSGGGQRRSNAPVIEIDGVEYYDQRPLIDSGEYKQGAATFRAVDKRAAGNAGLQEQYWLYSKGGDLNDDVADLLEANDIDF